jgi:hypothetical protein
MRELESEREDKENQPMVSKLRPCDTNVGIGSGKRMRSAGDEEEPDDMAQLWGQDKSPSKLLTGTGKCFLVLIINQPMVPVIF